VRLERSSSVVPAGGVKPLLEPLSTRERTILSYMETMLSTEEIASELFLSTNTVKTHAKSIYRKLGVSRRRQAVLRGRALELL
jgi:LuxR family maltose regulon positive regulatory protein